METKGSSLKTLLSPLDYNHICSVIEAKALKIKHRNSWANISIGLLDHAYEVLLTNIKMEWQTFNMKRSGTQYVAMVTELFSSYWRAHLAECYSIVSNISDTNWLSYLFSSYLNKIWLGVWRHHLANMHIFETLISLERKEIFENSKQHLCAHEVCLFMFQNGLD